MAVVTAVDGPGTCQDLQCCKSTSPTIASLGLASGLLPVSPTRLEELWSVELLHDPRTRTALGCLVLKFSYYANNREEQCSRIKRIMCHLCNMSTRSCSSSPSLSLPQSIRGTTVLLFTSATFSHHTLHLITLKSTLLIWLFFSLKSSNGKLLIYLGILFWEEGWKLSKLSFRDWNYLCFF